MEFTQEELKAIQSEWAKGSTENQFLLFISECKKRGLSPGTHLIFQLRRTKEYDADAGASIWVSKPYWITTISALRLIIERTGKYAGQTEPEYIYLDDDGNPNVVSKIPLPQKGSNQIPREPWAVRVGIKRRDFDEPIYGLARFESVAGFAKTDKGLVLSSMWAKRGPEMCAKCAEADGIRKAAPEEAGSFYIAEELKNEVEETPTETKTLAPAPSSPVVPKVDQTAAIGTTEPRPGEEKPLPTLTELIVGKPVEEKAPEPEKTKRGRKPKEIPDNGNQGITDEDFDTIGRPKPEFDEEANRKEAEDFAEDVCSATPVPDRLPTPEQKNTYVSRVREFVVTHKLSQKSLGEYVVTTLSGKKESKELTVGDWDKAFTALDKAAADGSLKELVKQNG